MGTRVDSLRSRMDMQDGRRLEIAAQVGSDVPLFLIGGTVLGVDRGQEVHPLPDLEPVWCVVAAPELGVSTAAGLSRLGCAVRGRGFDRRGQRS